MTDIIEYPKVLYKGDTIDYIMQNTQDSDDEKAMRDAGWADYADLPIGEVVEPQSNDAEQAYANAMARIAELEAELRTYQLKDMTAEELKAILTERSIEFGTRDSKETLLKLVIESE